MHGKEQRQVYSIVPSQSGSLKPPTLLSNKGFKNEIHNYRRAVILFFGFVSPIRPGSIAR